MVDREQALNGVQNAARENALDIASGTPSIDQPGGAKRAKQRMERQFVAHVAAVMAGVSEEDIEKAHERGKNEGKSPN